MDGGALIGTLLPTGVAVTLSPLPIAAVVMLLLSANGHRSAVAFAWGWVTGIVLGVLVLAVAAEALPSPDATGHDPVSGVLTIVSGVVLLVLAAWQWTRRRLPDGRPASARWVRVLDGIGVRRAALLGVLSVVANPKNLVLSLAAGVAIGESRDGVPDIVVAIVVYVLVGAVAIVVPVAAVAIAPVRSARPLDLVRRALLRHGVVVLVVVLVVLGVVEVVEGLRQV
ncbi:hypothetical protein ASF23_06740 [Curtobacterium sp. Leaf261]|nr:hypothetical protein ASF23_06740 [Curtobacterium sp. Leaf261]